MSDLLLRTPFWLRWYDHQALYQTGDERILLTFDDGPHPQWTPQLLDILDRFNLRSLFFVCGNRLKQYPETARQIVTAGHELGMHGMYHKSLLFRSESAIREELMEEQLLFSEFNLPAARFVRPPFGYFFIPYKRAVRSLQLTSVIWNLTVKDYKCESENVILRRLLKLQRAGDVILLHDYSRCTGQLLSILSDYLTISQESGLHFVSHGEVL